MCYKILVLVVLCLECLTEIVSTLSNGGIMQETNTKNQGPSRRYYFYNPALIPHATAPLGMVVPHAFYNPVPYAQYEEEDEHEEDKVPTPIQLLTFIKQNQQKKRVKKKKGNKKFKKIKKGPKKCMPFKVRFIKKSDINSNDPFYNNIRSHLPYGYQDEYFPQTSNTQDLALLSFNATSLSANGTRVPEKLHFLYPRYFLHSRARIPSSKKIYRLSRPLRRRLKRPYKPIFRKPWPQINSWHLASPGKSVSEFPLKEPIPSAIGGSPPPTPWFNVYKDSRIPISFHYNEGQKVEEPTETFQYNKVVSNNYVNLHSSTPSYVTDNIEHLWNRSVHEAPTSNKPKEAILDDNQEKSSDPDYYRYGTYTRNQVKQDRRKPFYVQDNLDILSPVQEVQRKTNQVMASDQYSYQNNASSSERVVTVTPTTFWVPVPQASHPVSKKTIKKDNSQGSNKFKNYVGFGNKQMHYNSGGFRNLSANFENNTESYNFGDRINCSFDMSNTIENSSRNNKCHLPSKDVKNGGNFKSKNYIRTANRKAANKYYSIKELKNGEANLDTTANKYARGRFSSRKDMTNPSYVYTQEIPQAKSKIFKYTIDSDFKSTAKSEGRNYRQNMENLEKDGKGDMEIITAKYPQDDVNRVNTSLNNNSSLNRASRSSHNGFSAVVSSSMLVEEN